MATYVNKVTVTYFPRSSDFVLYLQDYLTVFIKLGSLVHNDTAFMAYINSVTVTYFLRSSDFALYLQCYFYGPLILAFIFKTV